MGAEAGGRTARRARRGWLALAGVVALSACASGHLAMVGRHQDEISLPDEPGALIQMRRNGCPDEPCPVYSVAIFSDGAVVYDGRANVGVVGRRSLRVRAADVSALISALDAMDFLDSAENCCLCPDAAAPGTVTLDYRPGAVAKTVLHDPRCASAPPALARLERQIDLATGAGQLASLPVHRGVALGAPGGSAR
jgi:hypothetical protein